LLATRKFSSKFKVFRGHPMMLFLELSFQDFHCGLLSCLKKESSYCFFVCMCACVCERESESQLQICSTWSVLTKFRMDMIAIRSQPVFPIFQCPIFGYNSTVNETCEMRVILAPFNLIIGLGKICRFVVICLSNIKQNGVCINCVFSFRFCDVN
jgi:hypothetical protein